MSKQNNSVVHAISEGIEQLQEAKNTIIGVKILSACFVLALLICLAGLNGCRQDCSCMGANNYGELDSKLEGCEVASADLDVKMDVRATADEIETKITVTNLGDDDAYGAKLVVLLPINVHVLNLTPSDSRIVSFNQYGGKVVYCLGQMHKQNNTSSNNFNRNISIKTSRLLKKDCNHCEEISAFAYSSSPDQAVQNNYATWKANCAMPDLIVESLAINSNWASGPHTVDVTIKNIGTADAGAFYLYVDAKNNNPEGQIASQAVKEYTGLAAGVSDVFSVNFDLNPFTAPNTVADIVKILGTVDANVTVAELYENNNEMVTNIP